MFFNKLAFSNILLFTQYILDYKWFPVCEDGTIISNEMVQAVEKNW